MDALNNRSLLRLEGFIDNEWVCGEQTFTVSNPANGQKLADVSDLGEEETLRAIDAASKTLRSSWGCSDASFRAEKLLALSNAIKGHIVDLALIETLEQGKPLAESSQEWRNSAQMIETVARQAVELHDYSIPTDSEVTHRVIREPIGVVAAITPWNFPVASVVNKCAAAMAAGCTVVLKPSELTPLSALAFASLVESVGFPAGVLNIIPASRPEKVGNPLMRDARVRMLTFTGSVNVGKKLAAEAATTVKRAELELGGNAPFIVFSDGQNPAETEALLELAATSLIGARFYNGGQICVGANRTYVEKKALPPFLDKLIPKIEALQVGSGLDASTDCGPLINPSAVAKIEALIEDALAKGAKCLCGGKRVHSEGYFFQPTLLVDVTPEMSIAQTEIFGPVVAIQTFTEEEEVVDAANDTSAGLAAYLFTADSERRATLPQRLEAGMVGCNTSDIFHPRLAFGGMKESGYGREGGEHALEAFLVDKNISYRKAF